MSDRYITVFCASSPRVEQKYIDFARETGYVLAEAGFGLVFGGGNHSLMGAAARAMHDRGGNVVGVIPHALRSIEGIAYELADELIITDTMDRRKEILFDRGDGFISLPGGIGTLEEFMEVVTLRNLGYHDKPIGLLNPFGFYDTLLSFFEELSEKRFLRAPVSESFVTSTSAGCLLGHASFQTLTNSKTDG